MGIKGIDKKQNERRKEMVAKRVKEENTIKAKFMDRMFQFEAQIIMQIVHKIMPATSCATYLIHLHCALFFVNCFVHVMDLDYAEA